MPETAKGSNKGRNGGPKDPPRRQEGKALPPHANRGLTYRDAGVDIGAKMRVIQRIRLLARGTLRKGVLNDIGSFGGLYDLAPAGPYRHPVLVSSTDGVGTKLKVAILIGNHRTVGMDLVNHCVNDI